MEENGEDIRSTSLNFSTVSNILKKTLLIFKQLNIFTHSINTEFLRCIECISCYKIFFIVVGESIQWQCDYVFYKHKGSLYPVAANLDIIEMSDMRSCQESLNSLNFLSEMLPEDGQNAWALASLNYSDKSGSSVFVQSYISPWLLFCKFCLMLPNIKLLEVLPSNGLSSEDFIRKKHINL